MTSEQLILLYNYKSYFYLALQSLIVLSGYTISPSPNIFAPEVSIYLGRYLFLTYQANHLIMVYYFLNFVSEISNNYLIKRLIFQLYPLVFCLSFFVTIGYYLLDFSNPENVNKRKVLSIEYKFIYVSSHFEHLLTFPLVLLFKKTHLLYVPNDSNYYVLTYSILYISLIQINKYLTQKWPYPIISDVENNFGSVGKNIILLFLLIVFNCVSKLIIFL